MNKYKCIDKGYSSFEYGKIYNEIDKGKYGYCVKYYVKTHPFAWQLVENDFILPERWCVKITEDNWEILGKYWNKQANRNCYTRFDFGYLHNYNLYEQIITLKGNLFASFHENEKRLNYEEITFEQFKKYVLKQDDMKEKEIIGYKLKEDCNQYKEAIKKLVDITCLTIELENLDINVHNSSIPKLKKAGVLDLWYEPVYKSKLSLPKINDYDGKMSESNSKVIYGCAEFDIYNLKCLFKYLNDISPSRNITSITLNSGVEITTEQISQILEYCDNI
jgi:hypothetical protein